MIPPKAIVLYYLLTTAGSQGTACVIQSNSQSTPPCALLLYVIFIWLIGKLYQRRGEGEGGQERWWGRGKDGWE